MSTAIADETLKTSAKAVRIEDEIARRGIHLRGKAERWGRCPKCGGHDRFSINTVKQVFNCRGCGKGGDVIDLVQHLDNADFMTACETLTGKRRVNGHAPNGKDRRVIREVTAAKFTYRDENGATLFEVRRIEFQNPDGSFVLKDGKRKKTFRQLRPDCDRPGRWINNLDGVDTAIPYRLPEILKVNERGELIVIVEGERKADLLWSWGIAATTNAMGAGKWKSEHSKYLNGADVVISPDNDERGRQHADAVAASLQGIANNIRLLDLPGLEPKEDIVDWAERGGDDRQLNELIASKARPWTASNDKEPTPLLIKTSKQFVIDFVPPDYIVDGLLQEGFLYSLTGATGAGKTAIALRLAASVALGVSFAGRETKRRRVLYLAAENPDDVRMRWIALSQHMHFDIDVIEVFFVEGVFKISEAKDRLREEAEKLGGDFGLVVIDTSPVFYEGDDENNRTQQGRHAVMLRDLISVIPGKPAVVANCHPVKNASSDSLLPAGGGNFLNQVDGNLTAAKTDSTTELHTQGKFRGVEFAPMHFMIKTVTHQDVKDSRGRLIPTVICEWISDKEKENIATQKVSDEDAILKLIAEDAKASRSTLAMRMGWKLYSGEPNKMKADRCIKALLKDKLIKETRRGNFALMPEGNSAIEAMK
jgi:hypothetical protein